LNNKQILVEAERIAKEAGYKKVAIIAVKLQESFC